MKLLKDFKAKVFPKFRDECIHVPENYSKLWAIPPYHTLHRPVAFSLELRFVFNHRLQKMGIGRPNGPVIDDPKDPLWNQFWVACGAEVVHNARKTVDEWE